MSCGLIDQFAHLFVYGCPLEDGAQVGVRTDVDRAPVIIQKGHSLPLGSHGDGVDIRRRHA